MTISVHQSTATADLPVSGKALSSGETGLKDGTETGTADNVFSNLLATLTGSNKSAKKTALETDASAAKMAKGAAKMTEGVASTAESALDKSADGVIDNLALADAEALAASDPTVDPIPGEKSQTTSESSDDFLARLDQSAQLLQTPVSAQTSAQIMPQTTAETLPGEGVAIPDTSGNGLPSLAATGNLGLAQQAKLAGGTAVNSPDSPLINSELADDVTLSKTGTLTKTDDLSEADFLSKTESLSETESLPEINSPTLSTAAPLELKTEIAQQAEIAQQTEQRAAAESGLSGIGLQGLPAGVEKQTATQMLDGARSGGKNKPFESLNAAVNANLAAVTEQAEMTDSADVASSDQIEQVDFSQLMDSVRKQEQPELAPRVLTKAPVLTEAEQQVLDKRVNLHNNSASSELHEKISIMAGKELQTATIRLDPAELGSLNIKLVVHNDQASVIIQAQNGQSRDLLEQQLPRLREMLQQQGITLGDTQVQADSGGQQQSAFQQFGQQPRQGTGQNNSNNSANYAVDSQTEVPVSTQYWQDSAKGVDFYA